MLVPSSEFFHPNSLPGVFFNSESFLGSCGVSQ